MDYTYYTDAEKEFLTNHLLNGIGEPQEFDQYLLQQPRHYYRLWDDNNNLVTYFLSQPNFVAHITHLDNLERCRPDWNYSNHHQETSVFFLARKKEFDVLNLIIKEFSLDTDIKNNNGHYFTEHYFSLDLFRKLPSEGYDSYFINAYFSLREIKEVMSYYPQHFLGKGELERALTKIQAITSHLEEAQQNCDYNIDIHIAKHYTVKNELDKLFNNFRLHTQLKNNLFHSNNRLIKTKI